jgi:double-stranded uracil-DNA glycosylase
MVTTRTKVVILGSMPGVASLERGEYYAHPRNRFWLVMQELIGLDASAPYGSRVRSLLEAGLGLWDVLRSCERPGSLDESIRSGSEVPNDIAGLLERSPISALAFNGAKAFRMFEQVVMAPGLVRRDTVQLLQLPSTSPANAACQLPCLVDAWRELRQYL